MRPLLTIALLLALAAGAKAQTVTGAGITTGPVCEPGYFLKKPDYACTKMPPMQEAKPMLQNNVTSADPISAGTFPTINLAPRYKPLNPDWVAGDSVCINDEGRFRPCRLLHPISHQSPIHRSHQPTTSTHHKPKGKHR